MPSRTCSPRGTTWRRLRTCRRTPASAGPTTRWRRRSPGCATRCSSSIPTCSSRPAGLQVALRTLAKRSSRHGGFALRFELGNGRPYGSLYPHESLLLTAARELLTNVAHHARAENVTVRLVREDETVVLEIADDGSGFDPRELPLRLAEGHIGLHSQRERIESVGGQLEIRSA